MGKPQRHRVPVDLSARHLKLLGRIRVALGKWGMPASSAMAMRTAIEVLEEQLYPKRGAAKNDEAAVAQEDGISAGLL